jgi:hypothetical protein
MNVTEVHDYIVKHICVRQSDIIVAKKYIERYISSCPCAETGILIESFLKENGNPIPKNIALDDEINRASIIDNAVKAISWKNAAIEAIWGLIHNNVLYPKGHGLHDTTYTLSYSSHGSSGGGIPFTNLFIPVPQHVMRSYSTVCIPKQPLTDPDLFLGEIDIPNLADDIKDSLKEAVKCFRHDLYTPALAMLGRASEGAWIELGLALANALPPELADKAEKIRQDMDDPKSSVANKIKKLRGYCNHEELKAIIKASGGSLSDLDMAVTWSDNVRDSRNAVHYVVNLAMKNTYEKIAALLIGSAPVIRNIYTIINSTQNSANKP